MATMSLAQEQPVIRLHTPGKIVARKQLALPRALTTSAADDVVKLTSSKSSPSLVKVVRKSPAAIGARMTSTASLAKISPEKPVTAPVAKGVAEIRLSPGSKLPAPADLCTQAFLLSRRYHLDFHEVKNVLKQLQKSIDGLKEKEKMDLCVFGSFLCSVFAVPLIPEDLILHAYNSSKAEDGSIVVEHFVQWYRDNMFNTVAPLNSATDRQQSEDMIRALARKFQISEVDVDNVKKVFDKFDTDKSGAIEFNEFEEMMCRFLHVSDKADIPAERMQRFFKEINKDGSGEVNFEEFTEWYLKYFGNSEYGCPLQSFYASHMPDVQRRNSLIESRLTIE